MENQPASECVCHVKDCYLCIDLVIESSDGARFGAHKRNLEQYSAGFPTAEETVFDNIVTLSEEASVLGPLLHFMHNTRQPDLSKLSFVTLELLAEAAEKYMVFSAMQVCKIYMEKAVRAYPLDVFVYAIKHDYLDVADEAAPLLICIPLGKFLDLATICDVPANTVIRFIRYRERWSNLIGILYGSITVVLHRGGVETCDKWAEFYNTILLDVKLDPGSLSRFPEIANENRHLLDDCTHCWIKVEWLKNKIAVGIAGIPRFSGI